MQQKPKFLTDLIESQLKRNQNLPEYKRPVGNLNQQDLEKIAKNQNLQILPQYFVQNQRNQDSDKEQQSNFRRGRRMQEEVHSDGVQGFLSQRTPQRMFKNWHPRVENLSIDSSAAQTPVLVKKNSFAIGGSFSNPRNENSPVLVTTVKKQQILPGERKTIKKIIDLRRNHRAKNQDQEKLSYTVEPLQLKTSAVFEDNLYGQTERRNSSGHASPPKKTDFLGRFITPVKNHQNLTPIKTIRATSFLSISRNRSPSLASDGKRDAKQNVLSRGFQRRRDIPEIQQDLEKLAKLCKDQETANIILQRILDEFQSPSNHLEMRGYLDSVPSLQVHLRSKQTELSKRIGNVELEILEKMQQVDALKEINVANVSRLQQIQKKQFETQFIESEMRELKFKTQRLRQIREEQQLKSKTDTHAQTLKFEEKCREQIELVAIEMALNNRSIIDPEVSQLRREIRLLQQQLNN